MTMRSGIPIPTIAKMMWKPSDMAICNRAARRSLMRRGHVASWHSVVG
jgi:hypothetical protein